MNKFFTLVCVWFGVLIPSLVLGAIDSECNFAIIDGVFYAPDTCVRSSDDSYILACNDDDNAIVKEHYDNTKCSGDPDYLQSVFPTKFRCDSSDCVLTLTTYYTNDSSLVCGDDEPDDYQETALVDGGCMNITTEVNDTYTAHSFLFSCSNTEKVFMFNGTGCLGDNETITYPYCYNTTDDDTGLMRYFEVLDCDGCTRINLSFGINIGLLFALFWYL